MQVTTQLYISEPIPELDICPIIASTVASTRIKYPIHSGGIDLANIVQGERGREPL